MGVEVSLGNTELQKQPRRQRERAYGKPELASPCCDEGPLGMCLEYLSIFLGVYLSIFLRTLPQSLAAHGAEAPEPQVVPLHLMAPCGISSMNMLFTVF